MDNNCSAIGCTNRQKKGNGIQFHRFPTDKDRRKRWIQAMKRMKLRDTSKHWEPKSHDRICCHHFIGGKPSDDPAHPAYIPSVLNFRRVSKAAHRHSERYRRCLVRGQSRNLQPLKETSDVCVSKSMVTRGTDPLPDEMEAELKALTGRYSELQTCYTSLQSEFQRLQDENRKM